MKVTILNKELVPAKTSYGFHKIILTCSVKQWFKKPYTLVVWHYLFEPGYWLVDTFLWLEFPLTYESRLYRAIQRAYIGK